MSQKSADLIREIINMHHLTIVDFSLVTNLSRSSIHKYLLGSTIRPHAARKISAGLWERFQVGIPYQKFIE